MIRQSVQSFLCLLATAVFLIGILGIADPGKVDAGQLLFGAGPHVLGLALTCWMFWLHPTAGMISLGGALCAAGLQWWDTFGRQTEGFEWQFNNALSAGLTSYCNYLIVLITLCVTAVFMARHESLQRTAGPDR